MLLRAGGSIGALECALERIEAKSFEITVGAVGALRPRLSVDRQPLVAVFDDVAADADHALDEILRRIDRIAEHDDVATLRVAQRDDLLFDDRQADTVDEFVDENEIADLERGSHRRRRNLERLSEKRSQQKHDQQNGKERLRVFDPRRLS